MSNGSTDYKLGELDAKMTDISRRLDQNSEEHSEIKDSIKELNIWRWKVVGAVGVLSIAGNIALKYILN